MSEATSGGRSPTREGTVKTGRRSFLASLSAAIGMILVGRRADAQGPGIPKISRSAANDELAKLGFAEIHAPEVPDGFGLARIRRAGDIKFAKAPEPQANLDIVRLVEVGGTVQTERIRILVARQPAGHYPQLRDRQPMEKTVISKSTKKFDLEYFDGRYAPPPDVERGLVPADGWDRRHHVVVLRGTDVVIGTDAPKDLLSREALERMIASMV